MTKSTTNAATQFTLTRTFQAPRELVFKAWTEADRLARWFGPVGFELVHGKLDLRPGGIYHYGMAKDGTTMWGLWEFREVKVPERLVFLQSFADENANKARPPWTEVWPLQTLSTIHFTEENGQTTLTLISEPLNATEAETEAFLKMFSSMQQGWGGTLNQLDNYLAQA